MKKTFWVWVADLWCRLMHPAPMWPAHGHYRCAACWREYAVPWEVGAVMVDRINHVSRSERPRINSDRIARPAHSW